MAPCLQMDIGWLLDDAIESMSGPSGSVIHSRKMQQVLRADSAVAEDMTVSMRIDLEGLDCLWQQRTKERCDTLLDPAYMHAIMWPWYMRLSTPVLYALHSMVQVLNPVP